MSQKWLAVIVHDSKPGNIFDPFGHFLTLSDISSDILYEKPAAYSFLEKSQRSPVRSGSYSRLRPSRVTRNEWCALCF